MTTVIDKPLHKQLEDLGYAPARASKWAVVLDVHEHCLVMCSACGRRMSGPDVWISCCELHDTKEEEAQEYGQALEHYAWDLLSFKDVLEVPQ